METFFLALKRSLVATIFVVFAFIAVYIPQPYNTVDTVEAGGGQALEVTQLVNKGLLKQNIVQTTATALSAGNLWFKENVLDGIAWAVAKRVVSSMVQSLIDWINSGFQGRPQFLSDFKGFLLEVADEAFGEYIEGLGGVGSFICSPFRLDAQVSVALSYAQSRSNGGDGQPAPTCTLSGIFNNIENFISGTFSDGGWDDWVDITSQPEVYTPYGAILSAQAGLRARLINAEGEELTKLDWGDGFLSGEVCNSVDGPNGADVRCVISKPGKTISESLSKALGAGQDTLVTADEINEVIVALFEQLASTAITGVNGLLGLSGGTGYSYDFDAGSYLDQLTSDQTDLSSGESSLGFLEASLQVQRDYNALAQEYLPQLTTLNLFNLNGDEEVNSAAAKANEVIETTGGPNGTINRLESMIAIYSDPNITEIQQQSLLQQFYSLPLYSESEYLVSQRLWEDLVGSN